MAAHTERPWLAGETHDLAPRSVLASRVVGSASKLNRDPAFLTALQRRGAAQADRFLGALAVERAVLTRDPVALADVVAPGAVLYSSAPFRPRDPDGGSRRGRLRDLRERGLGP